jgi:hypothetical protein
MRNVSIYLLFYAMLGFAVPETYLCISEENFFRSLVNLHTAYVHSSIRYAVNVRLTTNIENLIYHSGLCYAFGALKKGEMIINK